MSGEKNVHVEVGGRTSRASEDTYTPLVDVYETDEGTVLVAEMPGVRPDQARVEVDKGVLTISGVSGWDEPGQGYARTYVGFNGGEFSRAFALSDEVDRERITAAMGDGVLTLKLPKAEAAKIRKIEIKAE